MYKLFEILELLGSGAGVNSFAEHIILHMKAVQSDLILHPLHILFGRGHGDTASTTTGSIIIREGHGDTGFGGGTGHGRSVDIDIRGTRAWGKRRQKEDQENSGNRGC